MRKVIVLCHFLNIKTAFSPRAGFSVFQHTDVPYYHHQKNCVSSSTSFPIAPAEAKLSEQQVVIPYTTSVAKI